MSVQSQGLRDGAPPATAGGAPSPPAPEETVRRRRPRRTHRWRTRDRVGLSLAGVLLFGLVLEAVTRAGIVDPEYLPPFSTILGRFVEFFGDPDFYPQLGATLGSFLLGLSIAITLGITGGVVFGLSEAVYRSCRTVIELIRPIPAVALIPVGILLFGTGPVMKTIIVVYASVFPILFNAMYGVRNVDPLAKEMARSFGRSRFDVIRSVVVPAAGPMMWTGIRASSTIALVVVITVELITGGSDGIGATLAVARSVSDVLTVYAAIIVAGLLGLLVNIVLGSIERKLFAWSSTTKEG